MFQRVCVCVCVYHPPLGMRGITPKLFCEHDMSYMLHAFVFAIQKTCRGTWGMKRTGCWSNQCMSDMQPCEARATLLAHVITVCKHHTLQTLVTSPLGQHSSFLFSKKTPCQSRSNHCMSDEQLCQYTYNFVIACDGIVQKLN